MRITEEHSKKIESLITEKRFTLQEIISLLDNLYTDNQIRYHIKKYYPSLKGNIVKEYSKGGTKLEFILKEIFPYDKIVSEFPLGERLRVDFVIKEPYNLAFEFDGIQHSEYSEFFHGSKGAFIESQQRDDRKEVLLSNRGINLIRLNKTDFDKDAIEKAIEQVGHGSGVIVDQDLLTPKEKADIRSKEQKERLKRYKDVQKRRQSKVESEASKSYKESLKEKQKEYRKQQYQRQKEWLKKNRKK